MAAQIPIVATTSTPGIARNSKKRPASPSHNGSSAGGYSASKKKKVSSSSFTQVCGGLSGLRVRGPCGAGRGRVHRTGRGMAKVLDLEVSAPVGVDRWCK